MWLTVREYADKIGKTTQMVYLDIRTRKIPVEKVEKRIKTSKIIYILYEDEKGVGGETKEESVEGV